MTYKDAKFFATVIYKLKVKHHFVWRTQILWKWKHC